MILFIGILSLITSIGLGFASFILFIQKNTRFKKLLVYTVIAFGIFVNFTIWSVTSEFNNATDIKNQKIAEDLEKIDRMKQILLEDNQKEEQKKAEKTTIEEKKAAEAKKADEAKKVEEVKKIEEAKKSLGMTPEQFKQKFNNVANSIDTALIISDVTVEKGPVQDVFQYSYSDSLFIQGAVNHSNGQIRNLSVWLLPDRDLIEVTQFLLAGISLTSTVDTNLTKDEISDLILQDLGLMNEEFKRDGNYKKEIVKNNNRYQLFKDNDLGIIVFEIRNANDKN
ncbi:hypothetical protein [Paenibacillus naphthalenovorans]|uniref:Uncharacterized protein n=1 Tax=Paenibacillus naphthalenovorans TaxID=162209 RepID=A0A0U2W6Z2_9BACL|nr:hypothetical protein [Paenibacillus naphthalenovorans]ALS23181.1 hypothetical protein IJ22_28080 [Paenibacillus naphthalenovorans]